MKNFIVGIDVSKATLDFCLIDSLNPTKSILENKISNNSKGINELFTMITKFNIDLKDVFFCFENTGIYSLPIFSSLYDLDYDFWEITALDIKYSKGISRGKTDKIDAKSIAQYGVSNFHKYRKKAFPIKDIQKLKLLSTERDKVLKSISILEKTKENKGFYSKEVYNEVKKINQKIIRQLQLTIKNIELKMLEIVAKNEELSKQKELIESIPGIGSQTALYLIITTQGFSKFSNWRKMACYSGIAPFEYSSGTSIKHKTRVNHIADKKMKSMLHMCALSAIRHNSELKFYFKRKQEEGKNKMLIINNVRGKLLARVFSVINRKEPYVNTYKFAS